MGSNFSADFSSELVKGRPFINIILVFPVWFFFWIFFPWKHTLLEEHLQHLLGASMQETIPLLVTIPEEPQGKSQVLLCWAEIGENSKSIFQICSSCASHAPRRSHTLILEFEFPAALPKSSAVTTLSPNAVSFYSFNKHVIFKSGHFATL